MPDYLDKLSATKVSYPFERWARSGPERYHPVLRGAFTDIFEHVVADLINAGENARLEAV